MPHPVLFPKKTFFYPIGNTSAVCLTRELPPDVPADVLLLGCGDARNILYTIFADASNRVYDFTCCDIEPAVLARNIILLSLLSDHSWDRDTRVLWNLYYHFYLDKSSLDLLRNHCRKLLEASETSETWSDSHFGRVFKFSTRRTLQELRTYWSNYLNFEDLPSKRKKQLKNDFVDGMKGAARTHSQLGLRALGCVGVLWEEAMPTLKTQFRRFWSSGTTFESSKDNALALHLNPTFVYSRRGEGFNVHYASDPLCSFHLEEAFLSPKPGRSPSVQIVVEHAMKEFNEWCLAFNRFLSTRSQDVTFRLFSGDALAFCQALNVDNSDDTPFFASSWMWSPIFLEDGPRVFDVIDSSNLIDHLGLMNVLALATPLLRPCSSSILHTDSLHIDVVHSFTSRFDEDISSLSLLFGITPVPYSSGLGIETYPEELLARHHVQPHTTISWRSSSCNSPEFGTNSGKLTVSPAHLASFLYRIYLNLFSKHEALHLAGRTTDFPHYGRGTFVRLLQLVRRNVSTGWEQTCELLIDLIGADRTLLVGLDYYQELCLELSVKGVYQIPGWLAAMSKIPKDLSFFAGWKHIPPAVVVILQIPRHEIAVLEDMPESDIGTPPLHCVIQGTGWSNSFSSVQFAFGKVVRGSSSQGTVQIHEDPRGWGGKSDLIMAVTAPSWIFSHNPNTTFVGLKVLSTPGTEMKWMSKLGMMMLIYKARISDLNHVFICSKYPNLDAPPSSHQHIGGSTLPNLPYNSPGTVVTPSSNHTTIATLTIRANCTDGDARDRLSEGAQVIGVQVSPIEMRVDIGGTKKYLQFPAFVDGSRATLRVARKSGYVEVVAPLDDRHVNRFPLAMNKALQPASAWNMHYVHLAKLPTLTSSESSFIEKHFATMFSDAEVIALKKYNDGILSETDPFLSFRVTLKSMCFQAVGQKFDAIQLEELGGSRKYLLFVGDTYRDVQCHSVVVSAFVIP
ncbi:hypothetical protein V5O48_010535, partial [Marasmius crinis-equi]